MLPSPRLSGRPIILSGSLEGLDNLISTGCPVRRVPAAPAPRGKRKEDYLRTIYELQRSTGRVRVKDVSSALGVSMPTALEELRELDQEGLIVYERGLVRLAEEAEKLAASLDRKRKVIMGFLEKVLGADPREAEQEACNLEHFLSEELLDSMERILNFAEECGGEFSEFMERVRSHRAGDCAGSRAAV